MEAAGPISTGDGEMAGISPPAMDVLARVVRLTGRTIEADGIMIFARDERDPRSLVCVASYGRAASPLAATRRDSALVRALETGVATEGRHDDEICFAAPMTWGGRPR